MRSNILIGMVEPFTASAGLAAAGWAAHKILGPALTGMGEWLASFVPDRQQNAKKIIDTAQKKADAKGRAGTASPRVIASAVNEGSWSSEEIVTSYLGGAIAASVDEDRDDDTVIPWVSMINRLSSDALAAHHAVYASIHQRRSSAEEFNPGLESELQKSLAFYVPAESFLKAFPDLDRFHAAMRVLSAEGLITSWLTGPVDSPEMIKRVEQLDRPDGESGLCVQPTVIGVALFMVGYGFSGTSTPEQFMGTDELGPMTTEDLETLPVFDGAIFLNARSGDDGGGTQ